MIFAELKARTLALHRRVALRGCLREVDIDPLFIAVVERAQAHLAHFGCLALKASVSADALRRLREEIEKMMAGGLLNYSKIVVLPSGVAHVTMMPLD